MATNRQFPTLGVSACIWRNDKVLLIQRAKPPVGIWAFPGGHVEPGERLEDAAARELMEACFAAAKSAGAFRVYWQTQEYNAPARSLYDTIVPRSSFIVYRKPL